MLSLIPGTGIRLVNTTATETDQPPCPITGRRVIMERELRTGEETELLLPLVLLPVHRIVLLLVHLIEPPQGYPTTVHPQAQLIGLPHQICLLVVPGVAEVIVEAPPEVE